MGGPSKQIVTLNKLFEENDFELMLVAGRVERSEAALDPSSFKNFVQINSLRRGINPIFDFIAFLKICLIIRKYKPDIIHTHLSKAWALGVAAKLVVSPKTKLVHTFHGHTLHSYFSGPSQILILNFQKFLASRSDVLVAVNETVRSELISKKIGVKADFQIANPGFKAPKKIDSLIARKELGLQKDTFIIGFAGRFERIKRPDILAEVVKLASHSNDQIQFVFCGGGSLYTEFQEQTVGFPVICLPWAEDLSSFYSSVNLMILVSDNEGTPLSIIEAGKVGVPTLTRNVGGIKGLINDSVNGFIAGDTSKEIADEIVKIMNDGQNLRNVSREAYCFFNKNFSEEIFLKNYRKIYFGLKK